ncbi:hypothetical protein [Bacillus altitudinis]|uniref:hypothetical protein n=1 Tax=Bacillus altitudinis TaxID=293387 RepID=UPI000542FDBD|nr:hypothetical protein [Bacillus altitudinis]KWZ66299.1 hypothetical protein HQ51_0207355 [Bacillus altitudinis]
MISVLETFMDEPWWIINESMSEFLNDELQREVHPHHILYGKKAIAVAKREDTDDVVYWISELKKFALVHLTYSVENSNPYPKTQLLTIVELEEHCKHVSDFY